MRKEDALVEEGAPSDPTEELWSWIENRLDKGFLSNSIKALEIHYAYALGELKEYYHSFMAAPHKTVSERAEKLIQRLARHYLLEYYYGFAVLQFQPSYLPRHRPSLRQQTIEKALRELATIGPARLTLDEYYTAALEQRLHRLLREFVTSLKPTLNLRRAVLRRMIMFSYSDDWEKLGQHAESMFQLRSFGLNGFYHIFQSTGFANTSEYESIRLHIERMSAQGEWGKITEAVRILASARLPDEQCTQLTEWVLSLLDTDKFLRQATDGPDDINERIDALGLSRPMTAAFKLLARLYKKIDRSESERAPTLRELIHPDLYDELEWQKRYVGRMLGELAWQSEAALQALPKYCPTDEIAQSLAGPSMEHVSVLKVLSVLLDNGDKSVLEDTLNELEEATQPLGRESFLALIAEARSAHNRSSWAAQLLQNAPALSAAAERELVNLLQTENDHSVLHSVIVMRRNLIKRGHSLSSRADMALFNRLKDLSFDPDTSLQLDYVFGLAELGRSSVLKVLQHSYEVLSVEQASAHAYACIEFLKAFAQAAGPLPVRTTDYWSGLRPFSTDEQEAKRQPVLDAATVAACCLVDPSDWLEDGRTLTSRLEAAIRLLKVSDTHRDAQEEAVNIIETAISKKPVYHMTAAKALRTVRFPELAVPLLKQLMDRAVEGDRYYHRPEVFGEALKSLALLTPMTPETLLALVDALRVTDNQNSRVSLTITTKFVYDELMPLLAHEVAPEAVPILFEFLWRTHCELCGKEILLEAYERRTWRLWVNEKVHRYTHIFRREGRYADGLAFLCVLQVLANTTDLTHGQQRIISRIYRTSWHALTQALCLLILGRQRPIQADTVRSFATIIDQSATGQSLKISLKLLVRGILFRLRNRYSPPESDVTGTLLCQDIAISLVGGWLRNQREERAIRTHKKDLVRALTKSTRAVRYGMETQLNSYKSLGGGSMGTRGIGTILGDAQRDEESERTEWIARPSDRAYEVLKDLIDPDEDQRGQD